MTQGAYTDDDPADGWFPESVAAGYDGPGGANAPEVVTPVVDVLEDLADGAVLEFAVGTGRIVACIAIAPGGDSAGYVGFDQYDVVTQQFTSNHVTVSPDGTGKFRRIPFRYVWPAELDLMARIAGMSLKYRWADGDRSELTADSAQHVSVWEKN